MSGKIVPGMQDNGDQTQVPPPDESTVESPEVIYVGQRRALIRRLGCGGAVILWALFMLIPGLLLLLAIQGEIVIGQSGSAPEPEVHPLIHVKLLMEIQTRGISITTSTAQSGTDNQTCMQTYVRYVLWQGSGDNVSYCDCYTRPDEQTAWELVSTGAGVCGQN